MLKQKQAGKTVSKAAPKAAAAQTGNVIDLLNRSLEMTKAEDDQVPVVGARFAEEKNKIRARA